MVVSTCICVILRRNKVTDIGVLDTAATALLVYGLLFFSLQLPSAALVIIALLAAIHLSLLKARVHAGLLWLVWSSEGAHWMLQHGL
jgi:hypothetical protein